MAPGAILPDETHAYWIQEGFKDKYLNRWVVDLVYSDEHGEWPAKTADAPGELLPSPSKLPSPPPTPAPPGQSVGPDASAPPPSDASLSPQEGGVISTSGIISTGTHDQDEVYRFAVYLDEDLAIQWYFRDNTPCRTLNDEDFFPQGWGKILTDVVHLQTMSEGLRRGMWWGQKRVKLSENGATDFYSLRNSQSTLRHARLLIAEGLARMFAKKASTNTPPLKDEDDVRYITASTALSKARDYITARSNEEGRRRLLTSALCTLMGCLIVLLFLAHLYDSEEAGDCAPSVSNFFRCIFRSELWLTSENWTLIHLSLLGGLGAFLSMLNGSMDHKYDAGSARWLYWMEGICRIFAGLLGALLLLVAIKAGVFVFPIGSTDSDDGWLLALVAILAGLSERLVPTFVTNVEAQLQSSDTPTPTSAPAPQP